MTEELRQAVEELQRGLDPAGRNTRKIFDAFYRRLMAYFLRKGVLRADTEDLISTALMTSFERITQLRDPERISAWIYAIARSELGRLLRSRRAEVSIEAGASAEAESGDQSSWIDKILGESPYVRRPETPHEEAIHHELEERIEECIDAMPRQMGRCARLRFLEGWSNQEIAEILQSNSGAVGYNIFEARKHLREALQEIRPGHEEDLDSEGPKGAARLAEEE